MKGAVFQSKLKDSISYLTTNAFSSNLKIHKAHEILLFYVISLNILVSFFILKFIYITYFKNSIDN